MYFNFAAKLGNAAFAIICLASFYYISRTVFLYTLKTPVMASLKAPLQLIVQTTRKTHPYLGLSLVLFIPYHAYSMFIVYGMTAKTLLGIASLTAASVTVLLGLLLWRDMSNQSVRRIHRISMFVLLLAVCLHKLAS